MIAPSRKTGRAFSIRSASTARAIHCCARLVDTGSLRPSRAARTHLTASVSASFTTRSHSKIRSSRAVICTSHPPCRGDSPRQSVVAFQLQDQLVQSTNIYPSPQHQCPSQVTASQAVYPSHPGSENQPPPQLPPSFLSLSLLSLSLSVLVLPTPPFTCQPPLLIRYVEWWRLASVSAWWGRQDKDKRSKMLRLPIRSQ